MYLCDGLKPSHKYIVEPFANWYICSGLELTGKHLAEVLLSNNYSADQKTQNS